MKAPFNIQEWFSNASCGSQRGQRSQRVRPAAGARLRMIAHERGGVGGGGSSASSSRGASFIGVRRGGGLDK